MDEGKAETSKLEDADDFSTAGLENSCPPLVVVSSRIKSHTLLAGCVNPGVEVVKYAYESTTLQRLFQMMDTTMKGRKALCIAFIAHGQAGCLKLCSQKVASIATLREDSELKDFFTNVATKFLNADSHFARVDILASSVAQGEEGRALLEQIRGFMKVKVCASSDILGEPEAGEQGASPVRIGALYFDVEKLKDWNGQSQATMANYEKIKVVGKGAYGAAVLYRKKDDDSQVILKEINLLNLTKEERSSALNEVQVLKVLDHPHIISYYDNFEEEGVLMIEMEYADGGTLAQFLKQQVKPLNEEEILRLFSQMVEAIQYLHDHHILHRDLKTANVFLTKDNNVKVGDFGISKILSETNQEAHTVLGTPYYISPEICEGKKYNAKSDMWSLGCILYEMTCLQKTFDSTNLPALVHKIVQAQFPPVKGDYSEDFKKLIQDLLQKDPDKRPSANEICSVRLPPLQLRYHTNNQQELAEGGEGEEEEGDQKSTKTTSLLLYLDGQTLLFNKIELPIKTRTAHVAIGFAHVLVVTQEGMAYSWGEGGHGQLGHGDTVSRSEPQLVEALRGKSITRCECGGEFSIFLSDNGLIMSVGRGDSGALGHGDFKDCLKPRLLEALLSDDITDVSCGESHVVTVTSDGHVYAWGAGGQGRLGTGTEENKCTPTKVAVQIPNTKTDELVRTVKCGLDGTMFLTSTGRLFASGSNQDNKLGLNQRETFIVQMKKLVNKTQLQVLQMLEPTPVKELGKHRVTDMALGPTHSAVLVETGTVYTFGRNSEGQLCSGNTQPSYIPVMVKSLLPKAWMVTCSELSCIILTEDMKVNVWGSRPIIRTPLADLLSPMATHKPTSDPQSVSADPQPEGQGGLPGVETSSQPPPVPSSPKLPTSLVAPVSTSPAAERKPSSGEIFPTGSQLTSPGGPNGGVARTKSGELQIRRQGSTFFFPDTPHTTYLCSEASRYSAMLKDMLSESLETSRAKVGGGVGAGTRPPQPSSRGVRRGPSMGSSIDLVKAEGVIMRPTPMDLLEISGSLFTPTTKGGQRLVKLEDIACFGSNLLVLIEVQEREGGVRRSSSVQAQLSLGMKLNKKIGFKSRVASPSHKSSPAQPKKEPAHSESATATTTAAAKVQDVSLIPLPETKPRADSGTKICNTTSASRSSSEDSYIPPWLKKEVEDALAGKPQPIKAKEGVQAFQSPNPVSPNNAQSSNLSPPNPVPNPQPLPQTVPSNPQTATSNPLPPPQTTLPPPQATQPPPQTAQPLPQITPPNLSTQSTNPQLPKLPPLQPGTKPLNTQSPDLTKQPSISHVHPKVPDSQSPRGGVTSPGGTPPAKKSSKSSRDVSSLGLDTPPKTESQGPKCESQGPKAGGPSHPSAASVAAQNQQAGSKLQQGEPHHGNCEGSASHTLKERNCNSSQNSEKGPEPPNVASPDAQTAVQPATQTNSPQRENNLNVSSDSAEESSETLKTNAKQKTPPLNPRNPKPPPSRGGGARTSSTSVSASSHLRSRSDQVKVPKAMGTSKKSQSASQIPDKMAERVKSPLAPTVEEGSDGEQPASPQNRLASPQSSFDDERQTPDHSGQTPPKTASSGKQGVNRTSAGDLGKKSKSSSNAHKTGHSVEVTTTSPYEAAPNFHPKRPLPQSKRNRTQTAPSKSIHDKHLQVNPFEKPPSDEKPPSNEKEVSNEEVAGPSPDERGGDHLLKGEVERLKTVVEEQNRMLQEGQQVVKELQKKMSEMELQNQPEQSGSPVPSNADPQPASQKRSLFKFKNQDKRVSSKVCAVM